MHPVVRDPPPPGVAPAHVEHLLVEERLPLLADQAAVQQVGRRQLEVDLDEDVAKVAIVVEQVHHTVAEAPVHHLG